MLRIATAYGASATELGASLRDSFVAAGVPSEVVVRSFYQVSSLSLAYLLALCGLDS